MSLLKGLIDRLHGDGLPNGLPNTGYSGGTAVLGAPPVEADAPAPAAAPPHRTSTTTLMEGDPAKLADQAHIAKSPKYQFLSLATQYGRGQEGDLLKELQNKYGQYWNGVTFDGKGNFNIGNSDPAWGGVKRVDAYGGYNGGGDLKARWGADEGAGAPAPSRGGLFGGSAIAPLLQGDAQGNIGRVMASMGQTKDSSYLDQLIAALGGQA